MRKAKAKRAQTSSRKTSRRKNGRRGTTGMPQEDLIQLILMDHKKIKPLLKALKDTLLPMDERWSMFEQFIPLFERHSRPEEYTLYNTMKEIKKLREEGFEGEVEHVLADQMVDEAKRESDDDILSAKLKILGELVEHHVQEEERNLLPNFKKSVGQQERLSLGRKFIELKQQMGETFNQEQESRSEGEWATSA